MDYINIAKIDFLQSHDGQPIAMQQLDLIHLRKLWIAKKLRTFDVRVVGLDILGTLPTAKAKL